MKDQISSSRLIIVIITSIFITLLVSFASAAGGAAAAINVHVEAFLECLKEHSDETNNPISNIIYTPKNSSYSSILQAYIRNLRFNETYNPKPQLILTVRHVSHVQAAIICGKLHGVQMKIRSGGHDYEGVSFTSRDHIDPFFVLDMFNYREINVNIGEETAWVQAGAILGEVYYRIAEKSNVHGFPAGVCPTVGVGGHFSGGGYGNMMRKYGLSIDNIIDAQMVDVRGQILNRASMGEDLFWAISGGGGSSFGVILAFKIKLVHVPSKVTVFRLEKTIMNHKQNQIIIKLVRKWHRIVSYLHQDIFIRMVLDVVNGTNNRATFPALFLGDSNTLLIMMNNSFPELGLQQKDCIEMTWIESVAYWAGFPIGTTSVKRLLSRIPPLNSRFKMKSDYLKNPMSEKDIHSLFKKMLELRTPTMEFSPYGGKMAEIPAWEKPFPHRAGNIAKIQYLTYWDTYGVEATKHYIELSRKLHEFMTPFVSKFPRQAFLNYRDFDIGITGNIVPYSYYEGYVYGVKYFGNNYNKLVQIKTKVDPENFFRNEQSIPTLPL